MRDAEDGVPYRSEIIQRVGAKASSQTLLTLGHPARTKTPRTASSAFRLYYAGNRAADAVFTGSFREIKRLVGFGDEIVDGVVPDI